MHRVLPLALSFVPFVLLALLLGVRCTKETSPTEPESSTQNQQAKVKNLTTEGSTPAGQVDDGGAPVNPAPSGSTSRAENSTTEGSPPAGKLEGGGDPVPLAVPNENDISTWVLRINQIRLGFHKFKTNSQQTASKNLNFTMESEINNIAAALGESILEKDEKLEINEGSGIGIFTQEQDGILVDYSASYFRQKVDTLDQEDLVSNVLKYTLQKITDDYPDFYAIGEDNNMIFQPGAGDMKPPPYDPFFRVNFNPNFVIMRRGPTLQDFMMLLDRGHRDLGISIKYENQFVVVVIACSGKPHMAGPIPSYVTQETEKLTKLTTPPENTSQIMSIARYLVALEVATIIDSANPLCQIGIGRNYTFAFRTEKENQTAGNLLQGLINGLEKIKSCKAESDHINKMYPDTLQFLTSYDKYNYCEMHIKRSKYGIGVAAIKGVTNVAVVVSFMDDNTSLYFPGPTAHFHNCRRQYSSGVVVPWHTNFIRSHKYYLQSSDIAQLISTSKPLANVNEGFAVGRNHTVAFRRIDQTKNIDLDKAFVTFITDLFSPSSQNTTENLNFPLQAITEDLLLLRDCRSFSDLVQIKYSYRMAEISPATALYRNKILLVLTVFMPSQTKYFDGITNYEGIERKQGIHIRDLGNKFISPSTPDKGPSLKVALDANACFNAEQLSAMLFQISQKNTNKLNSVADDLGRILVNSNAGSGSGVGFHKDGNYSTIFVRVGTDGINWNAKLYRYTDVANRAKEISLEVAVEYSARDGKGKMPSKNLKGFAVDSADFLLLREGIHPQDINQISSSGDNIGVSMISSGEISPNGNTANEAAKSNAPETKDELAELSPESLEYTMVVFVFPNSDYTSNHSQMKLLSVSTSEAEEELRSYLSEVQLTPPMRALGEILVQKLIAQSYDQCVFTGCGITADFHRLELKQEVPVIGTIELTRGSPERMAFKRYLEHKKTSDSSAVEFVESEPLHFKDEFDGKDTPYTVVSRKSCPEKMYQSLHARNGCVIGLGLAQDDKYIGILTVFKSPLPFLKASSTINNKRETDNQLKFGDASSLKLNLIADGIGAELSLRPEFPVIDSAYDGYGESEDTVIIFRKLKRGTQEPDALMTEFVTKILADGTSFNPFVTEITESDVEFTWDTGLGKSFEWRKYAPPWDAFQVTTRDALGAGFGSSQIKVGEEFEIVLVILIRFRKLVNTPVNADFLKKVSELWQATRSKPEVPEGNKRCLSKRFISRRASTIAADMAHRLTQINGKIPNGCGVGLHFFSVYGTIPSNKLEDPVSKARISYSQEPERCMVLAIDLFLEQVGKNKSKPESEMEIPVTMLDQTWEWLPVPGNPTTRIFTPIMKARSSWDQVIFKETTSGWGIAASYSSHTDSINVAIVARSNFSPFPNRATHLKKLNPKLSEANTSFSIALDLLAYQIGIKFATSKETIAASGITGNGMDFMTTFVQTVPTLSKEGGWMNTLMENLIEKLKVNIQDTAAKILTTSQPENVTVKTDFTPMFPQWRRKSIWDGILINSEQTTAAGFAVVSHETNKNLGDFVTVVIVIHSPTERLPISPNDIGIGPPYNTINQQRLNNGGEKLDRNSLSPRLNSIAEELVNKFWEDNGRKSHFKETNTILGAGLDIFAVCRLVTIENHESGVVDAKMDDVLRTLIQEMINGAKLDRVYDNNFKCTPQFDFRFANESELVDPLFTPLKDCDYIRNNFTFIWNKTTIFRAAAKHNKKYTLVSLVFLTPTFLENQNVKSLREDMNTARRVKYPDKNVALTPSSSSTALDLMATEAAWRNFEPFRNSGLPYISAKDEKKFTLTLASYKPLNFKNVELALRPWSLKIYLSGTTESKAARKSVSDIDDLKANTTEYDWKVTDKDTKSIGVYTISKPGEPQELFVWYYSENTNSSEGRRMVRASTLGSYTTNQDLKQGTGE